MGGRSDKTGGRVDDTNKGNSVRGSGRDTCDNRRKEFRKQPRGSM